MSTRKKVVGFELTYKEIEKLNEISQKTGLKKVELFRQRLLEHDTLIKRFDLLQQNLEQQISRKFSEEADNNLELLKFEVRNLEHKIELNVNQHFSNFAKKVLENVEEMKKITLKSVYDLVKEITD